MNSTFCIIRLLRMPVFCVLFFAANCSIYSEFADTLKPKNVLMLFAFEPSQPSYDRIVESVKDKLKTDYPHPLNFYMDFVQLSHFSSDEYLTEFFDYYKRKYSGRSVDLLLSIGPNLNPIVRKYCSPFLDSIPSVFLEIDLSSINKPQEINKENETAIFIKLDVKSHIEYALKLFPATKHFHLISGGSKTDSLYTDLYDQVLKSYSNNYHIKWYRGMDIKDIIPLVKELPPYSIVFMTSYQNDNSGRSVFSREVIRSIRNHVNAPLFFILDNGLEGTVGGPMINNIKVGEKIAETSIRILNGESPGEIENYSSSFQDYMFDWNQLKKWNIDVNTLPEESIIINREFTFFEKYGNYIIAGSFFILIETSLVFMLFVLYRKQKHQSAKLTAQEDRYKQLVDFNRLSELSELTASFSHELNQPLTAILSSSQAAQRFLANKNLEQELFDEILENIVEDVKRASGIINSLRSMIKKHTGEKNRVNLNSLANDVFLLFSSQAAVKDIKVQAEFDESDPFIMGDAVLIQQVILNMLLNASESVESKTQGYREILLKTEVEDGFVKVSVSDNGPGVADTLKDEIFKPFFSTKQTGLGIGLAICRSIVEDHHGKLSLEKNALGGAEFSFKLEVIK